MFNVLAWGGFLWRKSDGQPGWRTIWWGWHYLAAVAEGFRLAAQSQPS
jgi:hypothetical protein